MKQNPFKTASTAIDPMPLPTSPRRDDIPVEACFYLRYNRQKWLVRYNVNH